MGKKHGAAVASVALAWLLRRPGVTSVIIGARRADQLDQNLAAFEVVLDEDDMSALDRVSTPVLSFPAAFLANANMIMHGGATVNGEPSNRWPMAPTSDLDRF